MDMTEGLFMVEVWDTSKITFIPFQPKLQSASRMASPVGLGHGVDSDYSLGYSIHKINRNGVTEMYLISG